MRIFFLLLLAIPFPGKSQNAKIDTVQVVVVYTAHSDIDRIVKGDYHTYTLKATEIKADTGIISIHTEFGYLDLKKNYEFIPMNKLQPARLKSKP